MKNDLKLSQTILKHSIQNIPFLGQPPAFFITDISSKASSLLHSPGQGFSEATMTRRRHSRRCFSWPSTTMTRWLLEDLIPGQTSCDYAGYAIVTLVKAIIVIICYYDGVCGSVSTKPFQQQLYLSQAARAALLVSFSLT